MNALARVRPGLCLDKCERLSENDEKWREVDEMALFAIGFSSSFNRY